MHSRRSSLKFMGVAAFLCTLSFGLTARLSAQTVSYEAESLSYTGSGATTSVQTDVNSSGGKWVELAGNSVGDSITFTTGSIAAGTYQLQMEWKGLTSRGILQLSVDGSNVGGTLDQYATGQTYPTTTFGNVTFASTGTHTIKLAVTGKNASSSGYILSADKFTFNAVSVQQQAAAPVFNPVAGTYSSTQSVAITSATSGASIRYTTDGSTPSETAGTIYSGPVSISTTTTLKAIAFETGFTDSAVTSGTYTISTGGGGGTTVSFEAENLSYTGSGATTSVQTDTNSSGGKWVELAGNSVGDSITFTTGDVSAGTYQLQMEYKGLTSRGILQLSVDGSNVGGTLDEYASGQTYPTTTFGTVTFGSTGTHTIKLTVTGKNASSSGYILSADKFTFSAQSGGGGGTVSAPGFNPGGGTYGSAQNVSITTSTSGASIRYTTDGSTPSETTGTLYSSAVNISATATLKAIAFKSGMTDSAVTSATYTINTGGGGNYTPAQIIAAVQSHMTSSVQVNTKPHINTMTRALNVNVYQVASGVFAYTSSMAIDDDGSDPDPDPDHQDQTTWQDDNGAQLGAHHVPYYVLGDDCWDNEKKQGGNFHPCPHFYYPEHNITGLQFALIFYNGKVTGAVFGDTQGTDNTSTSSNDSRELGEASVKSAMNLGIPSSGTTGGVDNGVTVVIFSGSQWVVHGTNSTLNANAQAMVQKALNTLGADYGL